MQTSLFWWRMAAPGAMMREAGRVGGGRWEDHMRVASHSALRPWGRRRGLIAVTLSAMLLTGCMTNLFLLTDYDERTERQWVTAFLTDLAIGGALIGGAFALGEEGDPQWWLLSAGAASAGFGLLVLPLAQYPKPQPVVRPRPPKRSKPDEGSGKRKARPRGP